MAKSKYTSIGGQALIEGIMMKSPAKTALAVRLPDGGIDLSYMSDGFKKTVFGKIPVVRGVIAFVQSLVGGYKALMLSAEKSGYAEETDEKTGETTKLSTAAWAGISAVAGVLATVLCVVLFMYLPRLAVGGLESWLGEMGVVWHAVIEQTIKLLVFLAYLIAVSQMKDIHRVFSYHGAEHKTIFCYEAKLPLTVENVRKQKRFHPRCGTSFLVLMLLVSMVVSMAVQLLFKGAYANRLLWTAVKLLLVPLVCGIGYEILKLCGKYDNWLTRVLSAPGLWVQRITTKEPDDSMIEIAIAAMNAVIPENDGRPLSDFLPASATGEPDGEPDGEPADETNGEPTA